MKIDYEAIQDIYQPNPKPIKKGEDRYFCINCRKTLNQREFFKTGRKDKFPAGILPVCKTCSTLLIDDTDQRTFLPLLKELDVPYMPNEWRSLVARKSPKSPSIVGKYVSKMRLNQFKRYSWADTVELVKENNSNLLEALRQEYDSEVEAQKQLEEITEMTDIAPKKTADISSTDLYGLTSENSKYGLSAEEIIQLKIDWGADYTEDEFLALEQQFTNMTQSYVIQDPIALSNARIICKMTLKMNKFLDIDDVESVSKISRQLDLFIKSANLAPIQQKDRQQTTYSISQLAFQIEKDGGFIPNFYEGEINDNIDELLDDMKKYTYNLVMGESGLGQMIEDTMEIIEQTNEEENEKDDFFGDFEKEIMGEPIEEE